MPAIDLRSDTVTRPSPEMRQAMANAEVGDDVIDVDPTCERLQKLTAEILGKEAAIFMPSGSMTNQVGVRIHCKPGDEFICEAGCHIYNYEQGAFAQLSGVVARTIEGKAGVLSVDQLRGISDVRTIWAGRMLTSTRPIVNQDYDIAIVVTFNSEDAMQHYLNDPTHLEVKKRVLDRYVRKYVVYDFVSE